MTDKASQLGFGNVPVTGMKEFGKIGHESSIILAMWSQIMTDKAS